MNIEQVDHEGGPGKLDKEWKFSLEGRLITIQRFGTFCVWDWIDVLRDSEQVYRIKLEGDTRYEQFFGVIVRQYEGDHFSFIDYLDCVNCNDGILVQPRELVAEGIDTTLAQMYHDYTVRILRTSQ